MDKHISLSPCPFCGMGLTLDIDEEGGVAILHSLKGEKNCWFPSIVEIEMPVETTLEEMVEILNRRPIQESFEHALVGTSLVDAARLQDKYFEIQDINAELARRDEIITRLKEDAERLASTYVVEAFPHEWVCRGGCHHWARFGEQLDHAPDCPITLHRALMKELE